MEAEEPVAKNGEGLGPSIMSGRHKEDVRGVGPTVGLGGCTVLDSEQEISNLFTSKKSLHL